MISLASLDLTGAFNLLRLASYFPPLVAGAREKHADGLSL